ncbi:MAG: N(4)-(beta-N-acetylglucosaminyl)-L-asparaginase [Verrucomicrobia bacterium]|jgi:N4-(beta-N-acetylglucosaminyl)-L-asparaginase|nr:N(4)-(beta-N-acetylglucosaminyl)-L-asparaginase [Verrucomicrobiota bacterium]
MNFRQSRRAFMKSTGLVAAVAPLGSRAVVAAPAVVRSRTSRPVVIASANGNFHKNGGSKTCVELAFERMVGGTDILESLIAGVNLVELDPEDTSVGYGGLPNADGVVQLDSCCMHGPKKRAGGVAALEGVRTPSRVAHAVMESTDHHLLVGKGAQDFARNMGFAIEADLNTERSRKAWLEWKRQTDPKHYLRPEDRKTSAHVEPQRILRRLIADGVIPARHYWGTIHCNGVNAAGELAGVTTTSGLAWKIPGRVGDSPILGAGLYVDGAIGAAGSTGRGEANLYNLSSYLIIESMRQGRHPKDACLEALRRIRANTIERRLRKPNGDPNFNITFYAINAKGEHAAVAMYAEDDNDRGWAGQTDGRRVRYALCTEDGPVTLPCEGLISGSLQDNA